MKQAILAASFGTSDHKTREKTIGAIEGALAARWPDIPVRRAFTSGIIRRRLAREGMELDSVPQALERLEGEGFDRVVILPTHLLPGVEYERLREEAAPWRERFEALEIAGPLLESSRDLLAAAAAVAAAHRDLGPREVLVLMGHGTRHPADRVYGELGDVFEKLGHPNILMGTVEGSPTLEELLPRLRAMEPETVWLRPFMVVAGEHAHTDMAGEGADSWKNILAREGLRVRWVMEGLGELPEIRKLYLEHLSRVMA